MSANGAAANVTPVTEMSFSVFLNVILSSLSSLSTANSAFIAAVLEGATAREVPVLSSHLRVMAASSVSFAETVYVSGALLNSVTLIFVPVGSPVISIESPCLRLRADVAPAVPYFAQLCNRIRRINVDFHQQSLYKQSKVKMKGRQNKSRLEGYSKRFVIGACDGTRTCDRVLFLKRT